MKLRHKINFISYFMVLISLGGIYMDRYCTIDNINEYFCGYDFYTSLLIIFFAVGLKILYLIYRTARPCCRKKYSIKNYIDDDILGDRIIYGDQ